MKLSKNFSLGEFTKSQTAIRRGIKNEPTDEHLMNLLFLVGNVLQPVRDECGPVNINSGYRSSELNEAIGGSATSQHCAGMAADIEVAGVSNYDLAKYIADSDMDFDQLILEYPSADDPRAGWVHVSYTQSNRQQVLTAVREGGKTVYKSGLVL